MNHSTRLMRRPRRAPPSAARTAAAIIVVAVLALVAAACGSSPPSAGSGGGPSDAGGSGTPPSVVAYSHCMRSHGVPNFPDPTNGGASGPVFNITKAGISDAASHTGRFIAKLNECGRLVGSNAPESFE